MTDFNLAVIGGGPAGYSAAIRASQLGLKVVLIEKDKIGGTCLNRGCIPTKALLQGVGLKDEVEKASLLGIEAPNLKLNFNKLKDWQKNSVETLRNGVQGILKKHEITTINGTGQLVHNNQIKIMETGKLIEVENILLAMGSEPFILPIPGHDLPGVITSKELLELQEVPESMIIIGGGVIGLEFANIYNGLGTDVTIIELEKNILPYQDRTISEKMEEIMNKKGINIVTGERVEKIQESQEGLKVLFSDKSISGQKVLMAVGRKPALGNTLKVGLELENNYIKVDKYFETSLKGVYAAGDILDTPQLAHLATAEANTAIHNIAVRHFKNTDEKLKTVNYKAVPGAVYTDPAVASVGLTEQEAREKYDIESYIYPYKANGKAITMNKTEGFVKIIKENTYNEVLGVHIIGNNAYELIAGPTLGINLEITTEELAETIHPHPTVSEILMEAAEMAGPGAIHWT